MVIEAKTVEEYCSLVQPDRSAAFTRLVALAREKLPPGFAEGIAWGGPSWFVPLSRYAPGYLGDPTQPLPFLGLLDQKGHIGFYHLGIYAFPELLDWFRERWSALESGPPPGPGRLDMGKSCVRLRHPDRIPFGLLGELLGKISVDQWVETYERSRRA